MSKKKDFKADLELFLDQALEEEINFNLEILLKSKKDEKVSTKSKSSKRKRKKSNQ